MEFNLKLTNQFQNNYICLNILNTLHNNFQKNNSIFYNIC